MQDASSAARRPRTFCLSAKALKKKEKTRRKGWTASKIDQRKLQLFGMVNNSGCSRGVIDIRQALPSDCSADAAAGLRREKFPSDVCTHRGTAQRENLRETPSIRSLMHAPNFVAIRAPLTGSVAISFEYARSRAEWQIPARSSVPLDLFDYRSAINSIVSTLSLRFYRLSIPRRLFPSSSRCWSISQCSL